MNDLVSVIIPTYSRALYIDRAIDSVLEQSYKNIEIIIVDDNGFGSEDQRNTEKALEKYVANEKIKYIINKENIGGSEARNNGVMYSSGQFITFLDDDDTYDQDKIMEQIKIITSDEAIDACYCGMSYLNEKGIKVGKRNIYLDGSSELIKDHIFRPITGTPALLIKKSVFEAIQGFDNLKRYQDANIIFKILANGYYLKSIKRELVNVYIHENERISTSGKWIELEREYIKNAMKYTHLLSHKNAQYLIDKYHIQNCFCLDISLYNKLFCSFNVLKLRALLMQNLLGIFNYCRKSRGVSC